MTGCSKITGAPHPILQYNTQKGGSTNFYSLKHGRLRHEIANHSVFKMVLVLKLNKNQFQGIYIKFVLQSLHPFLRIIKRYDGPIRYSSYAFNKSSKLLS